MANTVTVEISEKLADMLTMVQILQESGAISITDETAGFHEMWTNMDPKDKVFLSGVVRGTMTAIGVRREV